MILISTKEKVKKVLKKNQPHLLIMATEVEEVEVNIEEGVNIEGEENTEGEGNIEEEENSEVEVGVDQ